MSMSWRPAVVWSSTGWRIAWPVTLAERRPLRRPRWPRTSGTWWFGHSGTLSFTGLSQGWLREAAKRWAADDLPNAASARGGAPAPGRRCVITWAPWCAVGVAADARRPRRASRGAGSGRHGGIPAPAGLPGNDGQITGDARIRACREVRAVLTRIRAMGLTRPGATAARLGEDFAIHLGDIPLEPEPAEPHRDLPPEMMRQLCAHLDALVSPQMRTAVELAIDTGRRPEEICDLDFDCLARDANGCPCWSTTITSQPPRPSPADQRAPRRWSPPAAPGAGPLAAHPARRAELLPTDQRNPDAVARSPALACRFAPRLGQPDAGAAHHRRDRVRQAQDRSLRLPTHLAQRHADAASRLMCCAS